MKSELELNICANDCYCLCQAYMPPLPEQYTCTRTRNYISMIYITEQKKNKKKNGELYAVAECVYI